MNKAELVASVQEKLGEPSRAAAERAVEAVIDSIKDGIRNDQNVSLVGFGSFTVSERAAREGVNPRNPSEKIQIKASRSVKFKPGASLKNIL